MSVVVSDMYSVILDAGVQAAIAAGTSGPAFNITGFQLGAPSAAQGATAVSTATGVDSWVYTGDANQIYYALLPDSDACLFRIVLDESVGNFAVGQICLMIGNTAFSKSVLYQQQNKWQSNLPSVYGNSISFDLVLAISDAQSCINLTMMQSLYAMLPEVADETLLPAAGSTLYNTYIVRNHTELGIPTVAVARNSEWYHTPHRLQAGQGEAVIAVPPAMFDVSVQVNMAVYFNYASGTYLPADPTDQNKFPIGIRTSISEVTQTGYVSRYMAGTASDIWPSNLTLNQMYSVQVGTPGIPGLTATYQAYGIAISNDLMYVDLAHSLTASWLDQNATVAGVQPLDESHKHLQVTETSDGFMIAADKLKLDNPIDFIIGSEGIITTALPGGKVSIQTDGTLGFIIAPDNLATGLFPGSPVCLQIASGVRTWVAADPAIPALRPIGVLSSDITRVVTSGNVIVSVTVPVPPIVGTLPTLSLTSDNPASIVNGVETPISPSTSPTVQASTTLNAGSILYAGEGVNAGTLQLSGNWIIGIALSPTLLCVDFDAIASIADHTNALTATSPIANKNATPAGVFAMMKQYVLSAIASFVSNSDLTGVVADFPMSSAPAGWLVADGSTVSRTVYANLFNKIGTAYGVGDGSSTFTLPDYRGVFRRGLDNNRGLDSGRTLGSYQADNYGNHAHGVNDPQHAHAVYDPQHSHVTDERHVYGSDGYASFSDSQHDTTEPGNGSTLTSPTNISIYSSATGLSIQSSGSAETAPKNVAVLVCIRY